MRAVKAISSKMLILVVAMLAAIGGWEITKGTVLKAQGAAPYHQPPGITGDNAPKDHFVCYKIHRKDDHPKFEAIAEIRNQFEYRTIRVKNGPSSLCVPTAKTLLSLTPTGHGQDDDDDDEEYDHGHSSPGKH
jgi:hypothetical protein